jgi:hypothetical protein
MCSRHLAQNFAHLAEAIEAEQIPATEAALAYLRAGQEALAYPDDPAGSLEAAAPELARQTLARLDARHPDWLQRRDARASARRTADLLDLLSYLADALALERSDLFADYTRWLAGSLARRGAPAEYLVEALAALDAALAGLAPEVRQAARVVLSAGRVAVESGPP